MATESRATPENGRHALASVSVIVGLAPAEQVVQALRVQRTVGREPAQRPPHDLGAGVVENLADNVTLVAGLIGEPAAEDESYLVPVPTEAVEDVLQHAQQTNVEQLVAEFFPQFPANCRFGCLAEIDAPAQRPVEGLILRRVVAFEDQEV